MCISKQLVKIFVSAELSPMNSSDKGKYESDLICGEMEQQSSHEWSLHHNLIITLPLH